MHESCMRVAVRVLHSCAFINSLNFIHNFLKLFVQMNFNTELMYMYMYTNIITRMLYFKY